MSLLDDVSIVVTPNGYKAGELYAVIPVPTEGTELLTNYDFASDLTGWTGYGTASATGGIATIGASSNSGIYQSILTEGVRYTVTVNVTSYDGVGTAQFVNNNGSNLYTITETGVQTFTFISVIASPYLYIRGLSNALFSLSSVSVKEYTSADMDVTRATAATRVDENGLVNYAQVISDTDLVTNGDFATDTDWSKGGGWSIGGGVATSNGNANSNISQNIPLTVGTDYSVTYTVVNASAGSQIGISTNATSIQIVRATDGTYTETFTATLASFYIRALWNNGSPVSVDNVSVKKVDLDNVPRIDYTGGGCPHILAEPQRTNLIPYSEAFNSWLARDNVTVAEDTSETTSPSGNNTASKITINSASTVRRLFEVVTTSSGSDYTFTLYAKKGTTDYIRFFLNSNIFNVIFDLTNGTKTVIAGSGSIEAVGNDWYRLQATGTSSLTTEVPQIQLSNSASINDYLYFWGAQFEESSYATSYIPTSGSTVTRNQDIFTRDGIGSLINSTEGVLFVEIAALQTTNTNAEYLVISDGTYTANSIMIQLRGGANQLAVWGYSGSVYQIAEIITLTDITDFNKIAIKWKLNDFEVFVNGSSVYSLATYTAPTGLDRIEFSRNGTAHFYGKVKQLQVYNTALTDEQLLQLTGESGTDFYESYAEMASALTYTIQ